MASKRSRDDFAPSIKDLAGKRAAYICSNPDCRAHTLAAAKNEGEFLYIGKVAHISAAAPGGPRYDGKLEATERGGISNALFLCSSCSDLIDKNKGAEFPSEMLKQWKLEHEEWVRTHLNKRIQGIGGDGGSGTIYGSRGTVIGGKGGSGGVGGSGGKGGSGVVYGDDALIIGGDGGSAGTEDGRGGRGARTPMERFGTPSQLWGFGRGGTGATTPEYDRRLELLQHIRFEYLERFPDDARFIMAGIDEVPCDWVNQRLSKLSEVWRVSPGAQGYVMPPLI